MRDPASLPSMSRDYVFDKISKSVISVLDQDQDPVYSRRNDTART